MIPHIYIVFSGPVCVLCRFTICAINRIRQYIMNEYSRNKCITTLPTSNEVMPRRDVFNDI